MTRDVTPEPVDRSRLSPAAHEVVRTGITTAPVSAAVLAAAVGRPAAGAVVTFDGVVRDHDGGRPVQGVEYVAHPSAGAVLADVAARVAGRHEVDALAVEHRTGELAVGDGALAVAVAAAHRAEAFRAAADLVDEVKAALPVWKRQVFADGTHEWVACP
ncbi:molybdenum cofactor biosynthesis protein MoaE [Cellulomonas triticagri]|uniref:Molybdenum cofactor biosynthesis protein MoaE n=1 Tax=Cellulomonas triticagri TaxID=2483352 RepID=A0A3M2JAJ0_9CELL|nr:molybdenum cofactor biosynthesis protein MoaE [Cellulomonas triticagri]RMI09141.1 molybdenum cofactor biosynthesis protein MoaE [Cellulomonas triticagri]